MAIISRPGKEGNATTYQGKVAAGYTNILAQEVDADIDAIYSAWNAGVDTVNIKDASVTVSKLAPGAVTGTALAPGSVTNAALAANSVNSSNIVNGTIVGADIAPNTITDSLMVSVAGAKLIAPWPPAVGVAPRGQVSGQASWVELDANTAATPNYNSGAPGWLLRLDYTGDNFEIWRTPAGATPAFVKLLSIANNGWLICTLPPGSIDRTTLAVNAANGPLVFQPNPSNFTLSNPGVWTTVATLPALTTRGGRVHLQANHALSVAGPGSAGAICMQRWIRDGTVPVAVWSFLVSTAAGVYTPFPGLNFIDAPPAGAHTYVFQVEVATGCTILGSNQTDSGFQAVEIG